MWLFLTRYQYNSWNTRVFKIVDKKISMLSVALGKVTPRLVGENIFSKSEKQIFISIME